jgi:hypothetical protein
MNAATAEKPRKKTAIQRALDVQEKKLKLMEQRAETEDEDMFFLKSLHPYLKQIRDKLMVQIAMITLVRDHLRDPPLYLIVCLSG